MTFTNKFSLSLSLSLYIYYFFIQVISQIYDIRTIFQLLFFFLNRVRQTFDQTLKFFLYLQCSNKNYHPPSYPSRSRTSSKSINLFPSKGAKKKKSETIPLIPYPTWARNTRHVHQLNYAHKQTLRCLLIASPLRKLFGGWASTVDNPLWDWISRQSYIYISAQTRETVVALHPTNSSLHESPWKQERARQVLTY